MKLVGAGAGQWVRSHFVPASTIAFAQPLDYALHKTDNGRGEDYNTWVDVAYSLINYFDRGGIGKIE